MTRAELEAYALSLGWAIHRPTSEPGRTDFGHNGCRITVRYSDGKDTPTLGLARDRDGNVQTINCANEHQDSVDGWARKNLGELAARYTPPPSLRDSVAAAVDPDDDDPEFADLPTVEGQR